MLSIPLGWLANRNRTLRAIVITGGSLLYTIPSLPLFVILPLIIPTRVLDETNLVVALSIYGVAIMARSASDALGSVPDPTLDASTAIGFSPAARFFRVELPLAGPVLLAGIRVVSVSTIALVSVGVIIGSANLGYLFQNGKQRGILEEVVVGILISLLLALVFDLDPGDHRPAADALEHRRRESPDGGSAVGMRTASGAGTSAGGSAR